MSLLKLISSDNFIPVNKELIKAVGLEEAVILGELCSELVYWTKHNGLTADGYFFSTVENMEEKTTLSDYKQRNALNHLKEKGIIDVKSEGYPAKRYIKIFEQGILDALNDEKPEVVTPKLELNRKRPVPEEVKPEPEVKTEEQPKKKVSRKDQLVEFVDTLGFQENTRKSLLDWIFQIGLPKGLTVDQLKAKLTDLNTTCNGNESLMQQAIERAYLNNYFGFFKPTTNSYNSTNTVVNKPAVPQYDVPAVRTNRVVDTYNDEVF